MLQGGHQGRHTLQIPNSASFRFHGNGPRVLIVVPAGGLDERNGGDDGARTHDLLVANQALYQLSYVPVIPSDRPVVLEGRSNRSAATPLSNARGNGIDEDAIADDVKESGRPRWTRTTDLTLIRRTL